MNIRRINASTMTALTILLMTGIAPSIEKDTKNCSFIYTTEAASYKSGDKVVVNVSQNSSLVLRDNYVNGKKKANLTKGTKLTLTGEVKNTNWAPVKVTSGSYSGYTGWVHTGYVISDTGVSTTTSSSIGSTTVTVKTTLNVRSGPSSSNGKLGSLSNGASVTVYERKNDWYKISYGSGYGWISSDYCANKNIGSTSGGSSSTTSTSGGSSSTSGGSSSTTSTSSKELGQPISKIKKGIKLATTSSVTPGDGKGKRYIPGNTVEIIRKHTKGSVTWFLTTDGYWVDGAYLKEVSEYIYDTKKESGRIRMTKSGHAASSPGGSAQSSNISLKANYVYTYSETSKIGGKMWYKVKALASDRTGWVSTNSCDEVTSRTYLGNTKKVALLVDSHVYSSSQCLSSQQKTSTPLKANKVLTVVDGGQTHVRVKYGIGKIGYVNKGVLKTDKNGFLARSGSQVKSPRNQIADVLVEMATQDSIIMNEVADDTMAMKVTPISEPIIATLNVAAEGEEDMFMQQYVVDVEVDGDKDKVESLRFGATDLNVIQKISKGEEVTVVVAKNEENKSLPKYILEANKEDKEAKLKAIAKIAKDYVRLAREAGIELEDFTEDEIKSIIG